MWSRKAKPGLVVLLLPSFIGWCLAGALSSLRAVSGAQRFEHFDRRLRSIARFHAQAVSAVAFNRECALRFAAHALDRALRGVAIDRATARDRGKLAAGLQ